MCFYYNANVYVLLCVTYRIYIPAAVSCWGRNSCMSWMSLARSWLSLAMLQISSWLKSGWICLHKSIWLMTLPMFDGPARFSVERYYINNVHYHTGNKQKFITVLICIRCSFNDAKRLIIFGLYSCNFFTFTNQNIQSYPSV